MLYRDWPQETDCRLVVCCLAIQILGRKRDRIRHTLRKPNIQHYTPSPDLETAGEDDERHYETYLETTGEEEERQV